MSNNKMNHNNFLCGKLGLSLLFLAVFFVSNSDADIIANIDGGAAPFADFQANDSSLDLVATSVGLDNSNGFTNARGAGQISGSTINLVGGGTTNLFADTTGTPQNNGFPAGPGAHNAFDPILGSNLFDNDGTPANAAQRLGVDFTNLSTLDTGSLVTITVYGIGDNFGQDATIFFDAGGDGSIEQTGNTVYNSGTTLRNDATGSIPFQQFTFVADGTTDLISVQLAAGPGLNSDGLGLGNEASQGRTHFSGFSISVVEPVPEPSSMALLGFASLCLITRRRR